MIDELIAEHLRGVRCASILDVGPGYAEFSRLAAQITGATKITFVDIDSDVLQFQERRCREAQIACASHRLLLDASSLGAIRGRFDLIHCQEVLEHLPDAQETLRVLRDMLTDDGRMIITVPTRMSERLIRFLNPAYMRDEPHGHVNEFDERALRALVERAGLSVEVFRCAQPQYFLGHAWLFGTRMKIEGSTGRILTHGVRGFIFGNLVKYSLPLFRATGLSRWARIMPRNYFVVAARREHTR